ncbi:MAG: hypothetical protein WC341_15035 [Bacteroidales bacterium]|jgi:hypothetical protein
MALAKDPLLKKINKSCTIEPRIDKAIIEYIHDQNHYLLREDGYKEPPYYNTVIEIALRRFLGLSAPEGYPQSPDEKHPAKQSPPSKPTPVVSDT